MNQTNQQEEEVKEVGIPFWIIVAGALIAGLIFWFLGSILSKAGS